MTLFNKLQDASVASGYRVLFEDGGSSSMQPLGEDAKIQAARATEYADFRSKRRLMEAINMGLVKKNGGWTDPLVLFCLIRELLFKSTKLCPSHSLADYQRFDCRSH